jgi:hypothetical protein
MRFVQSESPNGAPRVDAPSQGGHLGVGLRLIDLLTPWTRTGDRPFAEHGFPIIIPFHSVSQTAPRPVFRSLRFEWIVADDAAS